MKSASLIFILGVGMLLSSCGKSPSPHAGHVDSTGTQTANDYYTCPMHPQVRMDRPGVCPICGMDLVKASNSARPEGDAEVTGVSLSKSDQVLANVSTAIVAYEEVEKTARAFGTLEMAEPGKALISARFNGRIERIHVDAVGKHVKTGAPLFDIYSPDIVQAANEYLQALKSGPQGGTNVSTIHAKLTLMGLTDGQIQAFESEGSVPLVVTYLSPVSGTVIEKQIVNGSYVSEGAPLYEIADLSTLWNVAEVFESDVRDVSVGDKVSFTTAAYPDKVFSGTVALLYPVVNAETRTIKVRVVVGNPSGKLKPNMYTETVFRGARTRMLTVPSSAVLVTGKRNLVYVKVGPENNFQAREVLLGGKYDGKYGIISGLSEGEEIVREGGYLLDSEIQLTTGSGAEHQHGGSARVEASKPGTTQHTH
ncbi:MAG: family metal ion efflux pump rane fusion protein [Bacteroidetes bacterium]|nr:family metal ion efflux pump rane fusion protein [Bacteroidota bacterium]